MESTVSFTDRESGSAAFIAIRPLDDALALGIGVEQNGDLDLTVASDDARRIAEATLAALDRL